MLDAILLGAVVLTVALLVGVDMYRTKGESLHRQTDGSARDAGPKIIGATSGGRTEAFPEPAVTGIPAATHDVEPPRAPESISPPARSDQQSRSGPPAEHQRSSRELKNWSVGSRLLLLIIIPAATVVVVAFCVARVASALHGAGIHSTSSAFLSALTVGTAVIVVLASWFTIVVARSVLRPLHRLQIGAREVAEIRQPEAIRRTNASNGDGVRSDMAPIDVDSSDEIGEVARAFEQMRREIVRLSANEGALRGRLDAMFVNLSHRSQSLVERQMRLLEGLEQGEEDAERLASLVKMDRIAVRLHRNSQNLLVLAGQDPSNSWNRPLPLVDVIRAAVSEIEGSERVLLHAQPDIAVLGPVVNDLVHLLAELTENATSFSAADMAVDISGNLLTSGVLINITDRGIGMGAKEMAYANWQLENPRSTGLNVPRWLGLLVVARLAARHAIRVRLQPAEFGGLTALVWLPDEVVTVRSTIAPPRLSGFHSAGSGQALPPPTVDSGYVTAEQGGAPARSTEFAPLKEGQDTALGGRLMSEPARRSDSTWSAGGQRPVDRAEPPATVRPSGSGLPDVMGEHSGVSGQKTPALEGAAGDIGTGQVVGAGLPASGGSEPSHFASAAVGTTASSSHETSSAAVVVPASEDLSGTRRLPIFDEVESLWFRDGRNAPSSVDLVPAAGSRWSSPADEGWHAAQTVDSPTSSGATAAGLPRRQPNANLIPGAIPSSQPVAPNRSAAAARDRLAGFQRGVIEGRAASGKGINPGQEDQS